MGIWNGFWIDADKNLKSKAYAGKNNFIHP
jgi:hypothetical protein